MLWVSMQTITNCMWPRMQSVWSGIQQFEKIHALVQTSGYKNRPSLDSVSQCGNLTSCEAHVLEFLDQDETKELCMHIVIGDEFFNDFYTWCRMCWVSCQVLLDSLWEARLLKILCWEWFFLGVAAEEDQKIKDTIDINDGSRRQSISRILWSKGSLMSLYDQRDSIIGSIK